MTITAASPTSPTEVAQRLAQEPSLLRMVAQPIVDVASGVVAGYELLARFPEEWEAMPFEVFAAAERLGISGILTREVLRQAVLLRDGLPARTFLTLNCSPSDLADPETCEYLAELDLSRMFVELTEAAWPGEEESLLRAVDLVREHGGRIAADDVGAGYAGLLQLVRLRPELVKVDRSIVRRIPSDVAAAALVEMLGALAGRLDAWLVAEGVETQSQLSAFVQMGLPLVQGFYFGRPATPWASIEHADELSSMLADSPVPSSLMAHQRLPMPDELVLGEHSEVRAIRVGQSGTVRPLMMAPSTTVVEALERAMARPDALSRIAPIVVTDDHGRATGVVPVERLVRAVARDDDGTE
jgi:EAL domain-containing protein (putative c-di-GMP-specific phosphodiesterase class I)